MSRQRIADMIGMIRGMQIVANYALKFPKQAVDKTLKNSSLKTGIEDSFQEAKQKLGEFDPSKLPENIAGELRDFVERIYAVEKGVVEYAKITTTHAFENDEVSSHGLEKEFSKSSDEEIPPSSSQQMSQEAQEPKKTMPESEVKEAKKYATVKEKIATLKEAPKIELSDKDKEILRKLELEHEVRIKNQAMKQEAKAAEAKLSEEKGKEVLKDQNLTKPSVKPLQKLSPSAKERKVPSSRVGRAASFAGLGVGLSIGAAAEFTRRTLGLNESKSTVAKSLDSMFLSKANAERIVSTLCKVRGAALKIGQILSIQDNNLISPELQRAFERVRQSADFMPKWQVEQVLTRELGFDWRSKLASFEDKPFAAASIGQVHHGVLHNGKHVAIKIQYPGVADGIQSDIANLVGVLKIGNIFPEGMFIDNVVEVANRELAWEVDYVREAECSKKYKKLVEPYPEYYVPEVIDELCTKQVFTTELVEGIPVDKCMDMDVQTRQHICKMMMKLCTKELFVFRYMQTDPNWSNFFYNPETKQLVLLDFGACRDYEKAFIDKYIVMINAAGNGDREKVLKISQEMGFLTGYESKLMENAHVDAVMILGQVFDREREYFDFGGQDVTKRITALVPTIVNHRLCPPPEEIYSLHRKLSGVFLLCAKLQVKINCRDIFSEIYDNYTFG